VRRLIALPALLFISSIVVAFHGTALGAKADRLALNLAHWALHPA
jgi:hypothetical protein